MGPHRDPGAVVRIPAGDLAAIEAAAAKAWPRECCGLLVGHVDEGEAVISRILETDNLAPSDSNDRFEVDPAVHLRLQRTLRGTDEAVIGVFHSHPSGRAEPSDTDRQQAAVAGWVWLITAVTDKGVGETHAYRCSTPGPRATFDPLRLKTL